MHSGVVDDRLGAVLGSSAEGDVSARLTEEESGDAVAMVITEAGAPATCEANGMDGIDAANEANIE